MAQRFKHHQGLVSGLRPLLCLQQFISGLNRRLLHEQGQSLQSSFKGLLRARLALTLFSFALVQPELGGLRRLRQRQTLA